MGKWETGRKGDEGQSNGGQGGGGGGRKKRKLKNVLSHSFIVGVFPSFRLVGIIKYYEANQPIQGHCTDKICYFTNKILLTD